MIPFCFQDFGSFSPSLFRILYQVDFLLLPLLFGLVDIYSVPLPAEYFSASSSSLYCCVCMPIHILAVCGVHFLVEFPCCGLGWICGLSRFPGWDACVCVLVGGAGFLLSVVQ